MCGTIICYCGLPMGKCVFDVGEKPEICFYCGETITKVVHLKNKKKNADKLLQKPLSKKRERHDLRLITLYFQFECQQNTSRYEETYLPMREHTELEKSIDTCSQCVLICYCNFPMGECFYQKYINDDLCVCGQPQVLKHYNLSSEERDRRDIPLVKNAEYQKRNNQILMGWKYCCMNQKSCLEQQPLPWSFS